MQPGAREDALLLLGVDVLVDEDLAADLADLQIDQAGAIAPPPFIAPFIAMAATSDEKRQVFRQQHVLIEDNLAPRQKPARPVAPQRILAPADQDVGLGLTRLR